MTKKTQRETDSYLRKGMELRRKRAKQPATPVRTEEEAWAYIAAMPWWRRWAWTVEI